MIPTCRAATASTIRCDMDAVDITLVLALSGVTFLTGYQARDEIARGEVQRAVAHEQSLEALRHRAMWTSYAENYSGSTPIVTARSSVGNWTVECFQDLGVDPATVTFSFDTRANWPPIAEDQP